MKESGKKVAGQDLHKASNAIGFSLTAQQAAAFVGMLGIGAAYAIELTVKTGRPPGMSEIQALVQTFQEYDTVRSLLQNMLLYFFYMSIPFLLLVRFLHGKSLQKVPVRRIQHQKWLPVAAVIVMALSFTATMATALVGWLLAFVHLQSIGPVFSPPSGAGLFVLYLLFFCVLAPLCEEFIFRGVILQSLRRCGNGFAVLFSSILFAMMHGDIAQMPLAFLVGMALGYFAIWFESIWATVILHAMVNTVSTMVNLAEMSGKGAAANTAYILVGTVLVVVTLWGILFSRKLGLVRSAAAGAWKNGGHILRMIGTAFYTPGMVVFTCEVAMLCIAGIKIR